MIPVGPNTNRNNDAGNDKGNENEQVETVSGILKFRPSEDWFGEYGFDWIREKEDDYKERVINISDYMNHMSFFLADSFLRNKMGEKKFNAWKSQTVPTKEAWTNDQVIILQSKQTSYNQAENDLAQAKISGTQDDISRAERRLEGERNALEYQKKLVASPDEYYEEEVVSLYYDFEMDYNSDSYNYLDNRFNPDVKKVEKHLDHKAWMDDENNSGDQYINKTKEVVPDEVFEYCYKPEDVVKVVYRACGNNLWKRSEFKYSDMANGIAVLDFNKQMKESKEKRPQYCKDNNEQMAAMDAYIDFGTYRLSCFKEGKKIKIPIYSENAVGNQQWEKNDRLYVADTKNRYNNGTRVHSRDYKHIKSELIVNECVKVNDDDAKSFAASGSPWLSISDICNMKQDFSFEVFSTDYFPIKGGIDPLIHYKRITFSKYFIDCSLTYRKIDNKQYLVAVLDGLTALFIDGTLKELFFRGKWFPLDSFIQNEDDNEYSVLHPKRVFLKVLNEKISEVGLNRRWLMNEDLTIDKLSTDDSLKGLVITIMNPQDLIYAEADIEEITDKNGFHEYYYSDASEKKYRVYTWEEAYKDSFTFQIIKKGDAKECDKYCIPLLSTTLWQENEDDPDYQSYDGRKKIKIRSAYDTPKIVDNDPDITPNVYKLQLFYKDLIGKCDRLRLESNCPMLSIQPEGSSEYKETVFVEPKQNQTIHLKIGPCKKCKKEKCKIIWGSQQDVYSRYYQPSITAYTLTKQEAYDNDNEKCKNTRGLFAGKMHVQLFPARKYPIYIVQVQKRAGKIPSQDFKEAVEENLVELNNALLQAGLVPEIVRLDPIVVEGIIRGGVATITKEVFKNCMEALERKMTPPKKKKESYKNTKEKTPFYWLHHFLIIFVVDAEIKNSSAFQSVVEYKGDNYNFIFVGQHVKQYRGEVSLIAHEVLHALSNGHSFQLSGHYSGNKFCFPFGQTTNIMDYRKVGYTLHKFQWDIMREKSLPTWIKGNM